MRSFVLPKALGGIATGFKASGSITSDLRERSASCRAPLLRRIRVTFFSHNAIIHVLFVSACLIGVGLNLARAFAPGKIPNLWDAAELITTPQKLIFLMTRLGWPPIFWLQLVVSAFTPIAYTLWPPTVPEREALLDRDVKTGLAYPKLEARMQRKTIFGGWRYVRATISILYTVGLFIANEAA